MENAREIMRLVIEAAVAVPSRKTIALTDSTGASRRSRSRTDGVAVGAVVSTQSGYAICASSWKEMDHDRDEWMIRMTLRHPESEDEIMRVAKAMSRDWQETTRHIALLDADDHRLQSERDTKSTIRADFVRRLTEKGV